MPEMLLMHARGPLTSDQLPIGRWTSMHENANGLYAVGKLALANSQARDVHALIKAGVLDGLSIGYRPARFSVLPRGGPVKRRLHAIDLKEISVVNHPSNDLARITRVKSGIDAADPVTRALARLAASIH